MKKRSLESILSIFFAVGLFHAKGQILQGTTTLSSANNMTLTVTVNTSTNVVDIEYSGPNSVYYAVGFGGSAMNGTYAIITTGNGSISERRLGFWSSGVLLGSSFTTSNTSVAGSVRTTTASRPRVGPNNNYYTFPNTASTISLIWAKGNTSNLSNHGSGNRGTAIITLSNICNIPPTDLSDVEICQGDSALVFGAYRTTAGIYSDTVLTSAGCDSIINQELIVNTSQSMTLPQVDICNGDSALIFGQYQTMAGMYFDSLLTAKGCDSLISQTLAVNTVDTSVTAYTDSLVANAINATYQWIDCDSGQPLSGETNKTFIPVMAGNYRVEVTQNGCVDESDCFSAGSSISIFEETRSLRMYPNPVDDVLKVESSVSISAVYYIYNLAGQLMESGVLSGHSSEIDFSDLNHGVYTVKITDNESVKVQKIIKR